MQKNLLKESKGSIKLATDYLKHGKLVSIKTETVYGVACNPSNIIAIKKLYNLKNRPSFNPLIIHVNSVKMASDFVDFTEDAKKIAHAFWPGPLTLILKKKKNNLINDFSISGLDTIAVRMPNSQIFLNIIKSFGNPIAAPSANKSGYISSTTAQHVLDSFGSKVDLVIDSGKCELGLESTIIDLSNEPYIIKRLGVLDIKKIYKKTGINVKTERKNTKNINSPGQLEKHYSPKTPLIMNIKIPKDGDAFLSFGKNYIDNHKPSLNLSSEGNLKEAAYNLFDFLRRLDKLSMKRIVVTPIPKHGIGITINERLNRASS